MQKIVNGVIGGPRFKQRLKKTKKNLIETTPLPTEEVKVIVFEEEVTPVKITEEPVEVEEEIVTEESKEKDTYRKRKKKSTEDSLLEQ